MAANNRRQPDIDAAVPQAYHVDSELIRPASQLDRDSDQDSDASSTSPPPTHPFNFPTLNIDGSLPDISAQQSASRYRPTPPAALSSLGARANMLQRDEADNGSFADHQYDMIDDLSEISNEDHDTASITSNEEEGRLTPEDAMSQTELERSSELEEDELRARSPSSSGSMIEVSLQLPTSPSQDSSRPNLFRQVRAENALIDNYMSDDLETPRQSTIATAAQLGKVTSACASSSKTQAVENVSRILLVAGRSVPRATTDPICVKIASCLSSHNRKDLSTARIVRLPVTPSGIMHPSATVVNKEGDILATVQHCVEAAPRSASVSSAESSHQFRILDCDDQYSSWLTVGEGGKIDLERPQIAVLYVDHHADHPAWLESVSEALRDLDVPVLVVYQREGTNLPSHLHSLWSTALPMIQTAREDEVLSMDRDALIDVLREFPDLIPEIHIGKKTWPVDRLTNLGGAKLLFASPMIVLVLASLLALIIQPSMSPMANVGARREALSLALTSFDPNSDVARGLNITHLIPDRSQACKYSDTFGYQTTSNCPLDVVIESIPPNHFALSLPATTQFPTIVAAAVSRDDGAVIPANMTELIPGIHHVSFDAHEACGTLFLNMLTKNPDLDFTASYDFGHECRRHTTTELSEVVSKEVALMRGAAKTLTDKLSTEIGAGVAATKNVTTQVALYVMHDWQTKTKAGRAMLDRFVHDRNRTTSTMSKDFILMRKDLVEYCKDLSTTVTSNFEVAKSYSKVMIKAPLQLSRERLDGFRQAYSRKRAALKERQQDTKKRILDSHLLAGRSTYTIEAPELNLRESEIDQRDVEMQREYTKMMRQASMIDKFVRKLEKKGKSPDMTTELKGLKKMLREKESTLKEMQKQMEERRSKKHIDTINEWWNRHARYA